MNKKLLLIFAFILIGSIAYSLVIREKSVAPPAEHKINLADSKAELDFLNKAVRMARRNRLKGFCAKFGGNPMALAAAYKKLKRINKGYKVDKIIESEVTKNETLKSIYLEQNGKHYKVDVINDKKNHTKRLGGIINIGSE